MLVGVRARPPSGSVMAKQYRISPSSNGTSQRSCCSGVPNMASTSMLPVSGAEQLVSLGRQLDRPAHDLRQRGVVGVGEAGAPALVGEKEVPQPEPTGGALQLLQHRGGVDLVPEAVRCSWCTASAGYTWSSMNPVRRARSSSQRGEWAKSMAILRWGRPAYGRRSGFVGAHLDGGITPRARGNATPTAHGPATTVSTSRPRQAGTQPRVSLRPRSVKEPIRASTGIGR